MNKVSNEKIKKVLKGHKTFYKWKARKENLIVKQNKIDKKINNSLKNFT